MVNVFSSRARMPASRRSGGFVLLEIIVSMVILGIALATMMRSFTLSIAAVRKNDITTQATVLGETILQTLEAEPPSSGKVTGDFELEGAPNFSFEAEIERQRLRYRIKTQTRPTNLRELQITRMQIKHNDQRGRISTPIDAYLVLQPIERFSYESKLRNELFSASEGM